MKKTKNNGLSLRGKRLLRFGGNALGQPVPTSDPTSDPTITTVTTATTHVSETC